MFHSKWNENLDSYKNVLMNVYDFISNCQKVENNPNVLQLINGSTSGRPSKDYYYAIKRHKLLWHLATQMTSNTLMCQWKATYQDSTSVTLWKWQNYRDKEHRQWLPGGRVTRNENFLEWRKCYISLLWWLHDCMYLSKCVQFTRVNFTVCKSLKQKKLG